MIQIFIVFHKKIFDDCYKNIPNDVLYKYFTFIAVNKEIPKEYTPDKYKIINEYELPIYDDSFQKRGYNENSAIYHIYANNLHKDYKYIGFFQYDMVFNDNIIDYVHEHLIIEEDKFLNNDIYFSFCERDFYTCIGHGHDQNTYYHIVKDYEKFFNITFDKDKLYPLYNSYIIPVNSYNKIMKWIVQLYNQLYPWCVEYPNPTIFWYLGFIYERVMAFAIGNENLLKIHINVDHVREYTHQCY